MRYQPKISIIIPVYNAEKYLDECLHSCISQTYQIIEVIIINDGSSDQSFSIIEHYKQIDSRFIVFHQKNEGAVVAREKGLANCSGEFVMFLDSDDVLPIDSVELFVAAQKGNNADIVSGTISLCNSDLRQMKKIVPDIAIYDTRLSFACALLTEKLSFSLSGKLIRRTLFRRVLADPELKIGEDAYVTLQLFDNIETHIAIPNVVYLYRQHASSTVHKPSQKALNTICLFITKTIAYYERQPFYNNPVMHTAISYFVMKEYFTFLRMGGIYTSNCITEMINTVCLKDQQACALTASWRLYMLMIYRLNPFLGQLACSVIIYIRNLRGY